MTHPDRINGLDACGECGEVRGTNRAARSCYGCVQVRRPDSGPAWYGERGLYTALAFGLCVAALCGVARMLFGGAS
jgi:hypothetical protein